MVTYTESQRESFRLKREKTCHNFGFTLVAEFVPWSAMESKPRQIPPCPHTGRTLNWKVTLLRDGQEFLCTFVEDEVYSLPSCPWDWLDRPLTEEEANSIREESETGQWCDTGQPIAYSEGRTLLGLLLEAREMWDHGSFESWFPTREFESRFCDMNLLYKRKKEIACAFRNSFTEDELRQLYRAFNLDLDKPVIPEIAK
jgi:hypothetical protein